MSTRATLVDLNAQIVSDLQSMATAWEKFAAEIPERAETAAKTQRAPQRKRRHSKPKA